MNGQPPCAHWWNDDDPHDHECVLRDGHDDPHVCVCGAESDER